MATTRKAAGSAHTDAGSRDVDAFLGQLDHPLKDGIEALRGIILGASAGISEGIKWNSPSFRTTEWFATVNVRKDALMLILHLGAKTRDAGVAATRIDDPAGLLKWLGRDRAAVTFPDLKSVEDRRAALAQLLRQWIAFVD